MTQIKDQVVKALSKDIPLSRVGQRMLEIATMTEDHTKDYLSKAMEHALKRNVSQ